MTTNQANPPVICTVDITEDDMKDLVHIRNYFRANDKTQLEHLAYDVLDRVVRPYVTIADDQKDKTIRPLPTAEEIFTESTRLWPDHKDNGEQQIRAIGQYRHGFKLGAEYAIKIVGGEYIKGKQHEKIRLNWAVGVNTPM